MSKFRNAGQTCVCANRILVQAGVYDSFARRLAERIGRMIVGDSLNGGNDIGPLINPAALAKVEAHIEDAKAKGAVIVTGGSRHPAGNLFFEPTLLVNANDSMRVFREETFGPVAPLFRFETEEQAIAMANDTRAGLAAYVYTGSLNQYYHVSEALEYGMVGVNTGLISTEVAPFGGVKESGLGREGSRHGIDDYLDFKTVTVGGL